MNEFLNQIAALLVSIAAMWLVFVGLAVMVRGPQAGMAVFTWPLRAGFRLLRRIIGGLFIALGQAIRGGGHGGGRGDRRHRH